MDNDDSAAFLNRSRATGRADAAGTPGESTLASGTAVIGDLDAAGDLRVEGSVRGRIAVRGRLTIASGAVVEGIVGADEIDLWGRIAGIVRGRVEVRIHPGADVSGDVEAPRVRFVAPQSAAAGAPAQVPQAPPVAPIASPVAARTPAEPAAGAVAAASAAGAPMPPLGSIPPYAPRSLKPESPSEKREEVRAPALPTITGTERQIVVKRQ